MKTIIILTLLFIFGTTSFAQQEATKAKIINVDSAFFNIEKIPVFQNRVFTNRSLRGLGFQISLYHLKRPV